MSRISRARYASLYGPTTGDRVRLADTDLVVRIERDFAVYGEEAVFGGGKSIRESMAQGTTTRADGATAWTAGSMIPRLVSTAPGHPEQVPARCSVT